MSYYHRPSGTDKGCTLFFCVFSASESRDGAANQNGELWVQITVHVLGKTLQTWRQSQTVQALFAVPPTLPDRQWQGFSVCFVAIFARSDWFTWRTHPTPPFREFSYFFKYYLKVATSQRFFVPNNSKYTMISSTFTLSLALSAIPVVFFMFCYGRRVTTAAASFVLDNFCLQLFSPTKSVSAPRNLYAFFQQKLS